MRKVVKVEPLEPYHLRLHFDDGRVKCVDIEPYLFGEVFEPLRDPAFFLQVSVDVELGTIVWPNGADFCADFLYEHVPDASQPQTTTA